MVLYRVRARMPTTGGRNADRAECRPGAMPNIPIALYTARCSAKRGIKIACRLSVRPSVCLSVCNIGGSGSHKLEILETNCTDN